MERLDVDPDRAGVVPGEDFDRTLQLLREHKKTPAEKGGRSPLLCSFEEGFGALERELDAFEAREGKTGNGETPGPLHQPSAGPPPRPGEE